MSYESAAREIARETAESVPVLCPTDKAVETFAECIYPTDDPAEAVFVTLECPVCGHRTMVDLWDT